MKIYLVRHGETKWNVTGQHTSTTDLSLNEEGIRQAKKMRERLKEIHFDYVFASPMQRAIETCIQAGLGDQMKIKPELSEWDYGKYEGLTSDEIRKEVKGWRVFSHGAKGGESVADVEYRAKRLIEFLESLQGNVAIFSHGHFSRVLGAVWIGISAKNGANLTLNNATLSILGFEKGIRAIHRWNS